LTSCDPFGYRNRRAKRSTTSSCRWFLASPVQSRRSPSWANSPDKTWSLDTVVFKEVTKHTLLVCE